MKFGKSLTEKVRDDWKDYAVAYKAMKKALPKDDPDFFPHDAGGVDDQDGKDVNPESAYPQYWQLYAESLSSVTDFYSQKSNSATTEIKTLQSKVEKYRLSKLPGSTLSSTITVEDLMKQVTDAKIELQHVREFLSINYTAFSKILKKYDKRTFSSLREKKLEEILRDNPFLDDNAMDGFIYRVQQLINSLDEVEGRPKSCSSSNRSNVNRMEDTGRSLINHQESGSIFQQSKIILDKIEDSPFFAKYKAKRIPRFLPDEIEDGAFLGEGEFSVVKEVKAFHVNDLCPICVIHQLDSGDGADLPTDNGRQREPSTAIPIENFTMSIRADNASSQGDSDSFQDDHQEEDTEVEANRGFMMHHCLRSGSARYAIKQLKSSLSGTKRADGAIDLSIEAKFLSVLSHPNIIKLCGLGGSRGHPRSFIVLDRLYATLDVKIRFWKAKENDCKGFLGFKKHKSQLKVLWNERLLAGFDISRAIKYLHKHEIIYRDLKPENIGFDVKGNAKLFDFGLAKELREEDKIARDQYNASGRTGTRRYMAPEVVLCKHYGKPADSFSFSILLWEVLALSRPFKHYDYEKHANLVVQNGKRPELKKEWPVLIKNVLKRAWAPDPADRPTFNQICNSLSGEFADSSNGISRSERLLNETFSSRELDLSRTLSFKIQNGQNE